MSRFFLEGVWGPAGIRRTPAEVAAIEDEFSLVLLDREMDVLCADQLVVFDAIDAL